MKRYLLSFTTILLISTICSIQVEAQRKQTIKQRFNAGLIIGGTISQIDGDDFSGYNKSGLEGGLKGIAFLSQNISLNVEMLYIQKGARIEHYNGDRNQNRLLHLDFMDVPLYIQIKPSGEGDSWFFLDAGLYLSRLLDYQVEENMSLTAYPSLEETALQFARTEYGFLFGAGGDINKHLGIGIRMCYGLSKMYENPDIQRTLPDGSVNRDVYFQEMYGEKFYFFFRNYHLSARLIYNF